jgi:hypothetical protein
MKPGAVLAAAVGWAGVVSAHAHHHQHLHRRDTSATPCPAWTGGHRPPAYLTNLPLSVQAELPSWTGAPPSDWCSATAWMQSYVSCATVYESCKPTTTATSWGSWTDSVDPTTTAKGSWTGSAYPTTTWGSWSDSVDPAATATSTWGSWVDPGTTADPAKASTSSYSTWFSGWGSWVDPASASQCGCTTVTVTVTGDPTCK